MKIDDSFFLFVWLLQKAVIVGYRSVREACNLAPNALSFPTPCFYAEIYYKWMYHSHKAGNQITPHMVMRIKQNELPLNFSSGK